MAKPGYYLSSPANVVVFPVYPRPGGSIGEERGDILHETERGKRYVYNQFVRWTLSVPFRFWLAADYAAFLAFHQAVGGQSLPFYYVPDTATLTQSPVGTVYYVRKEKDFQPRALDRLAVVNDTRLTVYDYILELTGEPTDAEIDS